VPIPAIQNSVLQYMRGFDLGCVALTRDQRLISTTNPEGCLQAWWLQACDAGAVLAKARADHGDVPAAARALGVKLAPHDYVMQNTEQIVRRLDARLASAQRSGEVSFINREYKRRRQEAFARGKPYLPYNAVQARLRQALAEVAAGRAAPGAIVARVFERLWWRSGEGWGRFRTEKTASSSGKR